MKKVRGTSLAPWRSIEGAGLLLPCKFAVWQEGKDAVIAVLRPEVAVGLTEIEGLAPIAREAERHIERALVRLEGEDVEPFYSALAGILICGGLAAFAAIEQLRHRRWR